MRYGWTKYIKYRVGPGFWRSSSMVVINLDAYNAMNKKQRDAIDKAGEAFEPASQKYMRVLADKDNAAVKADGVKFIDLTGDEGKSFDGYRVWKILGLRKIKNGSKLRTIEEITP